MKKRFAFFALLFCLPLTVGNSAYADPFDGIKTGSVKTIEPITPSQPLEWYKTRVNAHIASNNQLFICGDRAGVQYVCTGTYLYYMDNTKDPSDPGRIYAKECDPGWMKTNPLFKDVTVGLCDNKNTCNGQVIKMSTKQWVCVTGVKPDDVRQIGVTGFSSQLGCLVNAGSTPTVDYYKKQKNAHVASDNKVFICGEMIPATELVPDGSYLYYENPKDSQQILVKKCTSKKFDDVTKNFPRCTDTNGYNGGTVITMPGARWVRVNDTAAKRIGVTGRSSQLGCVTEAQNTSSASTGTTATLADVKLYEARNAAGNSISVSGGKYMYCGQNSGNLADKMHVYFYRNSNGGDSGPEVMSTWCSTETPPSLTPCPGTSKNTQYDCKKITLIVNDKYAICTNLYTSQYKRLSVGDNEYVVVVAADADLKNTCYYFRTSTGTSGTNQSTQKDEKSGNQTAERSAGNQTASTAPATEKKLGGDCTPEDLTERKAEEGHYIRGTDTPLSCMATKCKEGHYMVYDAIKTERSNGYCIEMPSRKCPDGTTRIRDKGSIYSDCITDPNATKPGTGTDTKSTDNVDDKSGGGAAAGGNDKKKGNGTDTESPDNEGEKSGGAAGGNDEEEDNKPGDEETEPGNEGEGTPPEDDGKGDGTEPGSEEGTPPEGDGTKTDGEGDGTKTDGEGNGTKTDDASASQSGDAEQNDGPSAEELQRQHIEDLQKNYDDIKANEQSTANKLIGAVGVGATGIGGMMAVSALAEQRADADAERDMKAYLETMRCNYGAGMNIKGGERGVELPGGNDLAMLHMEYALLADSVKTAKAGLGLAPGIESEITLDKAETGLYDNGAIGKTGGAYTSIARALQDPEGVDAIAWEQLKNDTKKKLKTGAIVAGVGAAGSLVASVIANAKAPKESSAELNRRYADAIAVFKDTQKKVDALPTVSKCSDFNATGTYPNCNCGANAVFGNDGCTPCTGGRVATGGRCQCPADKPDLVNGVCTKPDPECLTGVVDANDCTKCGAHANQDSNGVCVCNNSTHKLDEETNTCVSKTEEVVQTVIDNLQRDTEIIKLDIKSDTAFELGQYRLGDTQLAKILNDFGEKLADATKENTATTNTIEQGDYCLTVTGYADRSGFNRDDSVQTRKTKNLNLSKRRAQTIADAITKRHSELNNEANIKVVGKGETECTENDFPEVPAEACRKVTVVMTAGKC